MKEIFCARIVFWGTFSLGKCRDLVKILEKGPRTFSSNFQDLSKYFLNVGENRDKLLKNSQKSVQVNTEENSKKFLRNF